MHREHLLWSTIPVVYKVQCLPINTMPDAPAIPQCSVSHRNSALPFCVALYRKHHRCDRHAARYPFPSCVLPLPEAVAPRLLSPTLSARSCPSTSSFCFLQHAVFFFFFFHALLPLQHCVGMPRPVRHQQHIPDHQHHRFNDVFV